MTDQIMEMTEEYEKGYHAGKQSLQPKWINAVDHSPIQDGMAELPAAGK